MKNKIGKIVESYIGTNKMSTKMTKEITKEIFIMMKRYKQKIDLKDQKNRARTLFAWIDTGKC